MRYIASYWRRKRMPREAAMANISNPYAPTKAGCARSWAARWSRRTWPASTRRWRESPFVLPARHLLALGRNHPRGLPGPGAGTDRARRRRHPPGEFRHLAGRRRPPGVGRQRLRRGRRDALRDRSRPAGDQRLAGKPDAGDAGGRDLRGHPRGLPPGPREAASRSCSTATGPGFASWWSCPTRRAPGSGEDREGRVQARAAALSSKRSPPPCPSRV